MARRWLIDGMNVIGSRPDKWWNDRHRAMRSLVDSLDHFARVTDDDVIVVFDKDPELARETANAGVVVASRKGRNAADHEIVDIVSAMRIPPACWWSRPTSP
jgi:predicted RNA-binding protein with PIN domain